MTGSGMLGDGEQSMEHGGTNKGGENVSRGLKGRESYGGRK